MYGYCKGWIFLSAFVVAIAASPLAFAQNYPTQQDRTERYVSYPYRPYYDNRRPRYYRPYRYYRDYYYPRYYRYNRYYDRNPHYYYYGPRGGFSVRFRT